MFWVSHLADQVKVTVGLCVKNAEATVREAINSVFSQDFPHELIELIVVDGYSVDKTLSIIKEGVKGIDIKSKIFCENKGLGHARQTVVDNAEGKYIVWVDGDMTLSKEYVRRLVEFMERNPKVGVAKGKYGMQKENSLVATLEDIEFVLSFRHAREMSSKILATSGCIYRVEAVWQIGGFDKNIKGVGEDMDAEYRIRAAGWLLCITPAIFYERRRKTWRSLWDEYFWHGSGGHFVFHILKRPRSILYKMFPPTAILVEVLRSSSAYKLVQRKSVFLLPFHWMFKRIAWCFGFAVSYVKRYRTSTDAN